MWTRTLRHLLASALVVPLLLASIQAAQAQKKPKGSVQGRPDVAVLVGVTFSIEEREQISEFFGRYGPQEMKPLPPGIRKKLARGKPMPPGIAKKVLPPELLGVLRERPGYQAVQVGWDVVLVEVATGVVRDVLMDVIR